MSGISHKQPRNHTNGKPSTMQTTTCTCLNSIHATTILSHTIYVFTTTSSTLTPPDHWASIHYPYHHESHYLIFHFHLHLSPDLSSKTQRSHHLYPFLANARIQKHLFTHVSCISMDIPQNSEQNKTRSPGFYLTYKPVWHKLGVNTS